MDLGRRVDLFVDAAPGEQLTVERDTRAVTKNHAETRIPTLQLVDQRANGGAVHFQHLLTAGETAMVGLKMDLGHSVLGATGR